MTKTKFLCGVALLASMATVASAQTKDSFSGKCEELKTQSVPAGDKSDHTYAVTQGKCTVSGQLAGAATRGGEYSEHSESTASSTKSWGTHVVTTDGGDKIFVKYQVSGVMKNGNYVFTQHTYALMGGTGKMKDAKGAGTCTWSGDNYTCTSDDHAAEGATHSTK
jgi:hypothetical protein